jgi:hypothetical protein
MATTVNLHCCYSSCALLLDVLRVIEHRSEGIHQRRSLLHRALKLVAACSGRVWLLRVRYAATANKLVSAHNSSNTCALSNNTMIRYFTESLCTFDRKGRCTCECVIRMYA